MGDWMTLSWKVLVVRGVVGIVFGVFAMAWPDLTIVALVVLWGIWAIVDAVMAAAAVFAPGSSTGTRIFFALLTVVGVVAGLFALLRPGVAAVTITWFLGIWLLVRGVVSLVSGVLPSTTSRGVVILSGLLDLLLGVLFVANPGRAAVGVAWVLGLIAVISGIALIVVGLLTRKAVKERSEGSAGSAGPTPQPAT